MYLFLRINLENIGVGTGGVFFYSECFPALSEKHNLFFSWLVISLCMSGLGTHPSPVVLLVESCGNPQIPLSRTCSKFLHQLSSKPLSAQRHVLTQRHWRHVLLCLPVLVLPQERIPFNLK